MCAPAEAVGCTVAGVVFKWVAGSVQLCRRWGSVDWLGHWPHALELKERACLEMLLPCLFPLVPFKVHWDRRRVVSFWAAWIGEAHLC